MSNKKVKKQWQQQPNKRTHFKWNTKNDLSKMKCQCEQRKRQHNKKKTTAYIQNGMKFLNRKYSMRWWINGWPVWPGFMCQSADICKFHWLYKKKPDWMSCNQSPYGKIFSSIATFVTMMMVMMMRCGWYALIARHKALQHQQLTEQIMRTYTIF